MIQKDWKTYLDKAYCSTAFSTTKRVELIDRREFVTTTLDKNAKTLVVYLAALLETAIHLSRKAYIKALIAKKTLTNVPT